MFEARDRKGELRAIAGGGRYDQLLQTFGGQQQPCAGFGFGDAVIMELLKDLHLLPQFEHKVNKVHLVFHCHTYNFAYAMCMMCTVSSWQITYARCKACCSSSAVRGSYRRR